ncbi:MAG: hypothetical protein ABIP17_06580 [Ilumatobacteraceae bacterium]
MSELEQLAQRVTATVSMIASKATRFARRLLGAVAVVCIGSFLLGIAAFDGGARSVWIVLGGVFAAIAIGGPLLAMWRIGMVTRHAPELVAEVRTLIERGQGTSRTVIDTFDADDPDRPADGRSAITLTREMAGLRGLAGAGLEGSARLTAAITALTGFPITVLTAIAISLVFAFLGVIFLVALAF